MNRTYVVTSLAIAALMLLAACGSQPDQTEVAVAVALTQTATAMQGEAASTEATATPIPTDVPLPTETAELQNGAIGVSFGAGVSSSPPSMVYAVDVETGQFVAVAVPEVEPGTPFFLEAPPAIYNIYARSSLAGDPAYFGYWAEAGNGLRKVGVTSGQNITGVTLDPPVDPCQPAYALPASPDGKFPATDSPATQQQLGCTTAALVTPVPGTTPTSSVYLLSLGSQHRYDEPWGGDRGDPCTAWTTNNFDDTDPNYRGFNVELLLANQSNSKVQENWGDGLSFTTQAGKVLKACYYPYDNMGPQPGASNPVTFFTVVPKGDFVSRAELALNDEIARLCFDGEGTSFSCN